MTQQTIASEGLMSDLVTKSNANFTELYTDLTNLLEKVGASAYIRGDTISCPLADTFYPLTGMFTNKELECFTLGTNLITYTCTQTLVMEIITQITAASSKNGAVLTFGILKNGSLITGSDTSREFAVGTSGAMGNVVTEELTENDTIQIVVKSSIAANDISLLDINTTLKRFY